MKHKRTYCRVPGCKNKAKITFAKKRVLAPEIKVCKSCLMKHRSKKLFSIWDVIKCYYSPLQVISGRRNKYAKPEKSFSSPSSKGSVRRGTQLRRSLFIAWQQRVLDCRHPYRMIRWDKLYGVARCTNCGDQVRKKKNTTSIYKTRKKRLKLDLKGRKSHLRKQTLDSMMMMFLFQRGIIDTKWQDAISIARAVNPGTKFSAASFSWYRNKFISRYITRKEPQMAKKKHKKKTRKSDPVKKKKKVKEKKKRTIQAIVLEYFDLVGPDKAKYEKTKARVLKVHPDSAFNETHMGWYRAKWREINE